jgi:sulfopyruvate decarboxylase TPP-binding subunit
MALLNIAQIPTYEIKSDNDMPLIGEALARTKTHTHPIAIVLRW